MVDGEVSYMCPRFSVHLLQCVSVFVPVDVVSPTVGLLGKGAGTTKKGEQGTSLGDHMTVLASQEHFT